MNPSERQVGGTHYCPKENMVQHWDYCVRSETPNLEYAASKYITRWRRKNGVVDLEKALHYIEQRNDNYLLGEGATKGA